MCEECVPPLTRPWEVRPAGTDLAILTSSDPGGFIVSLETLTPEVAVMSRSVGLAHSHQYRVYARKSQNRACRGDMLRSLDLLQYQALRRFGATLLHGMRSGPQEPVSFFYGESRIGISRISAELIEIFKTMPTNERIELSPEEARYIANGGRQTDPFLVQIALLAECIWKAYRPNLQQGLPLRGADHG